MPPPPRPVPIIGEKLGLFSFIGVSDVRGASGRLLWRMRCDCGEVRDLQPNRALTTPGSCGDVVHRVDDLTGSRFGRLVVLSLSGKTGKRDALWQCACDCGSQTFVASSSLKASKTKSCGCLKTQNLPANLSGRRFGRLVAIRLSGPVGRPRWICRCDCGREKVTSAGLLCSGQTISCGCAKLDQPGLMPLAVRAERAAAAQLRRARRVGAGGSFTAADVDALLKKQRGRCAWCSSSLAGGFHRDHRVALSAGGTNDIGNIDLLCAPCNLRKGSKDPIVWAAQNGRLL